MKDWACVYTVRQAFAVRRPIKYREVLRVLIYMYVETEIIRFLYISDGLFNDAVSTCDMG